MIWNNEPPASWGVYEIAFEASYTDWEGGISGTGIIDSDPLFASGPGEEPERNYYLSQLAAGDPADSPCVDAGDPQSPPLLGATRTDLVQDSVILDMGYHYPTPALVAGPGPAYDNPPLVRVWGFEEQDGPVYEYFAYGAPHHGVLVDCGDVDGDGRAETLTGAGPGAIYGPHVRGRNVDGGTVSPIPDLSFLAYGTNKYGINVTCGDVDGDGIDEIVTAPGPGIVFGAHIRGWDHDGVGLTPLPGYSFFAWNPEEARYGARVCADYLYHPEERDYLLVGAGPDPQMDSEIKIFGYDGSTVYFVDSIRAFPPGFTHGANPAAGRF